VPPDDTLRRIYIVSGKVQRAGYREIVKSIAIRLGVSGRVRNLPDDTVEVTCEAPKEALDRFASAIVFTKGLVRVDGVRLVEEVSVEPSGALFDVLRAAWQDEMAERGDAAAEYLGIVVDKLGEVGEKVDQVGAKVDQVGAKVDQVGTKVDQVGAKVDGVGQDVRSMHVDMNSQFANLDRRYDSIGVAANAILEEIRGLRQDIREKPS
jgi:acylphosphatase